MLLSPVYVHECVIAHLTSSLTLFTFVAHIGTDSHGKNASLELSEFAKGLPEGLLVPSNLIRILNSEAIGQGTV